MGGAGGYTPSLSVLPSKALRRENIDKLLFKLNLRLLLWLGLGTTQADDACGRMSWKACPGMQPQMMVETTPPCSKHSLVKLSISRASLQDQQQQSPNDQY